MKDSEYSKKRAMGRQAAMDQLLVLVADGMGVYEALRVVGRTPGAYDKWRRDYPEWARRVTNARLAKGDQTLPGADFITFRNTYFGNPTPPHHYRMIEAMERAEPDSVTMILAFPESAKTSVYVDRVCQRLALDPNHRTAIISEGQDLSRKIVRQIANRMTDRNVAGAYIDRWGPFRAEDRELSRPWSADYLAVVKSSHDAKEFSLESRGAGSTLYGGRFEEICLDDIQSDKNLAATGGLLTYIRQTVLTRPVKGVGKTIILGSRVGDRDIYRALDDAEIVDKVVTIPALDRHVSAEEHYTRIRGKIVANPDCPAQSSWPDYWTMQDLAVRRHKVGEEIWARTYMQHNVVATGATFTEDMVESAKDVDRPLGAVSYGTHRIASCDPALDTGNAAFLVAAVSPTKMLLLDAVERTDIYRSEDALNQIGDMSLTYRPTKWVIEANNYQKALERDDRMKALAAKFHFDTQPHITGRNKNDPVMGVKMMASAFLDGEIRIPWGDDAAKAAFGPLCDELRAWRPGARGSILKQDNVMALWMAWLDWSNNRRLFVVPPREKRPSWIGAA